MDPVWEAQILTHLKLIGKHLDFQINFNVPLVKKDESLEALSKQMESSEYKSGLDLSDDERLKMIVKKYKETGYFDDLNELIRIVAHKVRNPLTGISAAVEVLRERCGKDNSNEIIFEMVHKEIDRLENIVKEFLKTFSNK